MAGSVDTNPDLTDYVTKNVAAIRQREFYRAYLKSVKGLDEDLSIDEKVHTKIIHSFHSRVVASMISRLYVFKMPFGIGEICIGEEINKRKYIIKIVKQGDGSFKREKVNNSELRKVFRFWWNKASCRLENSEMYYLYILQRHSKSLGRYVEKQNSDPNLKNYRGHIIYRQK